MKVSSRRCAALVVGVAMVATVHGVRSVGAVGTASDNRSFTAESGLSAAVASRAATSPEPPPRGPGQGHGPPEGHGPGQAPDEPSSDEKLLPPGPGPSFLYEDALLAPEFENVGVWEADPLYVMGSNAYVNAEYLYQGFIFDDYGAETGYPRSHPHTGAALYRSGGNIHYPTDEATYAYNAADLLEFRVTTKGDQLHYRITLNTMIEPDVAAIAIGIDSDGNRSSGTDDWGYGIGSLGELGLDHVILTWGTGAELVSHVPDCVDCIDRREIESTVDVHRNQIELTVPMDPGTETWRHFLVTGLFDADEMAFKQIQEQADADNPGGAFLQDPPPIFNVGFRHHGQEPWRSVGAEVADMDDNLAAIQDGDPLDRGYWRDASQAKALAEKDISDFYADVDFGKLERRETAYDVPQSGLINGLYGSRYDFGEGIHNDGGVMMAGRIQPYALYIPKNFSFEEPTPLFLQLHGGSSPHNQILSAPNFIREFGEKRDALLLAPLARGPSFGFSNEAELDVLEALSHIDSQYNVDFDRLMVGGPSMGGTGTFNLAGRYPDLFHGAFSIVSGTASDQLLDNFRHVPLLLWNGAVDPIVLPTVGGVGAHRRMLERGYRHEFGVFPAYDHTRHYVEDEWGPAREYLDGQDRPPTYPWHVTYHSDPAASNPQWGLHHDKAYWLTDISVAPGAATAKVDARDLAAGQAPPEVRTYQELRSDPDHHVASGLEWMESVFSPRTENRLELDLQGVGAVRVWMDATRIDLSRPFELATDSTHEATVTLVSHVGQTVITVPASAATQTVTLP